VESTERVQLQRPPGVCMLMYARGRTFETPVWMLHATSGIAGPEPGAVVAEGPGRGAGVVV